MCQNKHGEHMQTYEWVKGEEAAEFIAIEIEKLKQSVISLSQHCGLVFLFLPRSALFVSRSLSLSPHSNLNENAVS